MSADRAQDAVFQSSPGTLAGCNQVQTPLSASQS